MKWIRRVIRIKRRWHQRRELWDTENGLSSQEPALQAENFFLPLFTAGEKENKIEVVSTIFSSFFLCARRANLEQSWCALNWNEALFS